MITEREAYMRAATIALEALREARIRPEDVADGHAIRTELRKIEHWLVKRSLGGDRIAIRQLEKELGRQVRMKGKAR